MFPFIVPLIVALLLPLPAPPEPFIIDFDVAVTVAPDKESVTVSLSWTPDPDAREPARFVVWRGNEVILPPLPPDARSWSTTENLYGEYQYSLAYVVDPPKYTPVPLQWETVIVQLGRISFDPVDGATGYVLYLSDDPDELNTVEPVLMPGQDFTTYPLAALISLGRLAAGQQTWIRVATCYGEGENAEISPPSDPVIWDGAFLARTIEWFVPATAEDVEFVR